MAAKAAAAGKAAAAATGLATKIFSGSKNMANRTVKYATPRLQTFWSYASYELRPPTLGEMPQVQESMNKIALSFRTGRWKHLTVKEAWLNTLVGMEIMFCFFIGECLGRGSLVGYSIPGAVHYDAGI